MLQMSGQIDPAEEKDDVQKPDVVPEPEQEKDGNPTPENQPADDTSEPEPEKQPADDAPKSEPKKAPPKKGAPSKKGAPPKKGAPKKGPPKKGPPRKAPPKSTGRLLIGLLVKIAVAAAVVWSVFTFVLGMSVHYGNNMFPAVHDGDLLVSLRMQKPYINSVVLYRINGKTEVGRVIALEGSVVDIAKNGLLTVNGVAPTAEIFYATYQAENSSIEFPYTVESGKVFILNDFRDDTNDSRVFGAVDKKDLEGPMLFTVRRRNF